MRRYTMSELPEPEYTGPLRVNWRPPEEGTGVRLPSGQVIGGTGSDPLGDLVDQISKHFGGPFGLGGGDFGTHTPGSGLPGPSDIGKVIDHISKHYFGGNLPISSNPGGTLGKGDPAAILGEMFGHLHDLPGFDPTGGYRHPSHDLPDVHAHLEKQRREVMKWLGSLGHGYDPNRGDPRRGLPPGRWEQQDDEEKEAIQREKSNEAYTVAVFTAIGMLVGLVTGGMTGLIAGGELGFLRGAAIAALERREFVHVPPPKFGRMPPPEDPSGGSGGGGPHSRNEMPAPEDPSGGTGVGGPRGRTEMAAPDPPEGIGVSGPHSRLRRADRYFPNPQGTGSGGPRSRDYYPNPEDIGSPTSPRS